jgi:hypothetical protein
MLLQLAHPSQENNKPLLEEGGREGGREGGKEGRRA